MLPALHDAVKQDVPFELSDHAARRVTVRGIELDWIERTLTDPDQDVSDRLDPTLRHAIKGIDEAGGRFLRVVYNQESWPIKVVTAHFDRRIRRCHEDRI